MASIIDFSDLTLNEQEALVVSQAVFEETFVKGPISDFHFIQTGVKMKTQIPFFGLLPMLGKVSSGCTPNTASGLDLTEKYWDPELIDFRLTHCQADVLQLYKMWERATKALDIWEKMDSTQMQFIVQRAIDAHKEAILRITSFGDEAGANVSGGGQITNGVDTGFFTMLNGLFQQIFAGVASSDIYKSTITENGAASKAAQLALGDTVALDTMREIYENIDPRAYEAGTLKFQMTRTLVNNWWALLEDKSLANAVMSGVEDQPTKLSYRGIPIEVRHDWDRNILANHNLGATYYLPHRIVLSPIENIPIGTSDEDSMNEIDSFYDKKDKTWYYDGASMIDMKLLEEHNVAVGF